MALGKRRTKTTTWQKSTSGQHRPATVWGASRPFASVIDRREPRSRQMGELGDAEWRPEDVVGTFTDMSKAAVVYRHHGRSASGLLTTVRAGSTESRPTEPFPGRCSPLYEGTHVADNPYKMRGHACRRSPRSPRLLHTQAGLPIRKPVPTGLSDHGGVAQLVRAAES